jgi:hypothetical protein
MKLIDSGIRVFVLARGTGARWLRGELNSLKVKIPLTDGCLEELVREADAEVLRDSDGPTAEESYLGRLQQELVKQARMVHRWTASDDKFAADDPAGQAFVRIARKYALPRPWKLTDPVAVESRRVRPSHWKWASAMEPRPAASA